MGDFNRYIPQTEEDCRKMLEAIGLKQVEDLFGSIPREYRLSKPLNLPPALSEPDLILHLQGLLSPVVLWRSMEQFPRRRGLPALHPFGRFQPDLPLRVLYGLYALPTGDQPGNASGRLRVSDPDVPVDRHGGFKCLPL